MPSNRRRFTDDQVREIRQSPLSARELAAQHGVSHPTILNIRDRRTYQDVSDHPGTDLGRPDPFKPELRGEYVFSDPLQFLYSIPDGYCGTVVTAPLARRPPSIIGHSSGWTKDDEQMAQYEYVDLQRRVIEQSLRVMGPAGVLLYLHRYEALTRRNLDTRHDIISGLPLRQIIIWNHQMRLFMPSGRRVNRVPNNYGVIFVFSGPRWAIPDETRRKAMAWGDVWSITPDLREDLWAPATRRRQREPYSMPAELADRCIAFGSGAVLDPFAGSGAVPLAAIRAGRDWLACDTDPSYIEAFETRRLMMW